MSGPDATPAEGLSREFIVVCGEDGALRWLDRRAERLLHAGPGARLQDLCTPGTADKAERLLAQAKLGRVDGWEVSLVLDGAPATVSFSAAADEAAALWLVGAPIPGHFTRAFAAVEEATTEIVALHRRLVAQHRELELRHAELVRLHGELDDSQRGLLTMHAELAEQSGELRRQAEIRGRVVASVSHELRTPLHAILGLCEMLAEGADGPLNAEQRTQVGFIRAAADELLQLVDDVLDLARVEAGRAPLRPASFTLADLVGSLRGMLRPLAPADGPVALVWEEPAADVVLETDRGKLAQIVRNLVSNALKFTERGQVRVRAEHDPVGDAVRIAVSDTGIGIAPADLERIFDEFVQLDGPLQRRARGSGLGLALTRRLAEALGGEVTVVSAPGVGSTFTVTVPRVHPEAAELRGLAERSERGADGRPAVLVVEADPRTLVLYDKYLKLAGFRVVPARDVAAARAALAAARPAAIVLDVLLGGETSWGFLAELKRDPATAAIPVLVSTVAPQEERARALGADEFWLKPLRREQLLGKLERLVSPRATTRVLVIDDDPKSRYVLRKQLRDAPYDVIEAGSGPTGVAVARARRPDVILLDFMLGDWTAFDVLEALKADPETSRIPVIIATSHGLGAAERARLGEQTEGVLAKGGLSREVALRRIHDALARAGPRGRDSR